MKKELLIFGLLMLVALSILGGCKMSTEKTATKEEQIEFLKAHEKEMTEYIKSQRSLVNEVHYNWESVEIGEVGGSFGRKSINFVGTVNKIKSIEDNTFSLMMDINRNSFPDLNSIQFGMGAQTLEKYNIRQAKEQ